MPVYEYRCQECRKLSSVLTYSWSSNSEPKCKHCGGANLTKLISSFSVHRSWGDSLDFDSSGGSMDDFGDDDDYGMDQFPGI